ncbi:MAG: DUF1232 domain-containing protein [bacterium]
MSEKRHLKVVRDDDFYQSLRRRIRDWSRDKGKDHKYLDYILAAPDLLHLLSKLSLDSRLSWGSRSKIGVGIAYFVFPLDFLPEALLGPVGLLDDIAVAAWIIDDLIKTAGPDIVREHWAGDDDVLELINRIVDSANEMIGSGMVRKLKNYLARHNLEGRPVKVINPSGK